MLRASVVSTCRTTLRSNSSALANGCAVYFFHAARCGSGIDAALR
jgi:hypothetical protein